MKLSIKKFLIFLCACFALAAACLALTAGKTTAHAEGVFEMVNGASVKFADDNSGIRFRVKMDAAKYAEIYENDNVELKFIITSKANFETAKSSGGNYMGIDKKQVADVDEAKIYKDGDYYYANGCLTKVRENNRTVELVAIAVEVINNNLYTYASEGEIGATGKLYDCLNQALLATSKDYIPSITGTEFFNWYGTAEYPVVINTEAAYSALAAKYDVYSTSLSTLKYNILDEVNDGSIAIPAENVTAMYKVTFDPDNGDATTIVVFKAGETIVPPSDPVKAEDNTYTYAFSGWGNMPATCTGSATYTAEYTPTYKNYTVTFKTHDGSTVLNTKTDYHYGETITTAPAIGTTYTVDDVTYEIDSYQSAFSTVNGNAEIRAASYRCAPTGKVQGFFNVYGDNTGKEKADTNTYVNLNAHTTLGGLSILNGERVLYRTLTNAAGLDQSSAVTLYYVPNDIMTELYVPFYLISVEGDLDMNMRRYAGIMSETLPVVYKDANGNTVAKANLETDTWYTAVYTLTGATAIYGEKYKLTMGATGASVELYYGRPYFALADGVSVDTFNNEIKDNLATTYETYNGKTGEVFACDNYSVKYLTYYNGLIPVFNSGVNVSFSETLWGQYLDYQTSGGKVMTMDVKFINVGTNAVNYNGHIYNGSAYPAISNAASNTFRQSNKFFIFYNSEGQSVNYQNLAFDTWYKMVIDIDAIKTGVAAQGTRVYESKNCSSIFFRSGDDAIAIGNVSFADNQIAFKNSKTTYTAVSSYYDNDELVSVISSGNDNLTTFSDTVANGYLAAQAEGGKVMRFDVKFTTSATYQGFVTATTYMSNSIRGNRIYVRFYNAEGTEVAYTNLATDTWYKMEFDIDAIKSAYGEQTVRSTDGSTGLSLRFWANASGETISVKNVEFVDAMVAFKTGGGGTVSNYIDEDGALVTVGSSNDQWNGRLFFADTLWTKYIAAQEAGGKVMSMNIKFDDTVSLSGYISGNNANLNTYRANKTYFRFYDLNGNAVDYANLVAGTWYRLVMDIDAIKTGIATQEWQNDGANSTIKFARESAGTISVKNVQFIDKADENA